MGRSRNTADVLRIWNSRAPWSTASRRSSIRTARSTSTCRSTGRSGRRCRSSDMPFYLHPRNPLADPLADLRGAPVADGPDLGVRPGDRGARAAPDRLGTVRRVPAPADRARPHGRRPALQHVAHRPPQRLGQGEAQAQGEEEDRRLLQRQLPPHHLGQFPHADADRRDARDRLRPDPLLHRLAVREHRPRRRAGSTPPRSARPTGKRSAARTRGACSNCNQGKPTWNSATSPSATTTTRTTRARPTSSCSRSASRRCSPTRSACTRPGSASITSTRSASIRAPTCCWRT